MNEVTFKRNQAREYKASTGETIIYCTTYWAKSFFETWDVVGKPVRGWYIQSADGSFEGTKFDVLNDAKAEIVKRHNPMQHTEIVLARAAKVLEKVGA